MVGWGLRAGIPPGTGLPRFAACSYGNVNPSAKAKAIILNQDSNGVGGFGAGMVVYRRSRSKSSFLLNDSLRTYCFLCAGTESNR
jgi:hypothetical protein